MLTLFHNNQQIILDNTEYYVRELASGLDEVIFDISIWDPNYALMNEEDNIVDRGGQRYLIKQIDAGAVTAKIVAQLDLDEWRASMLVGYNSGTKTVAQQIDAVKPTGWTVADRSGISIGRTISGDLTPLQVCEECRNTYKVYVRWDNNNKVVMIYSQNMGSPVGSFATRELNLKEINYKGKSQNFATRLYAYGKDGLSFADINGGKPYVDNNTYSNRVICAYWQDDRYTDKSSLLNDAQEHLAKIAVPERSYDCSIVDLQATNPELYNNLDFSLFTVATLIDDVKETAIDYQVVERHVWPYHPDHNDVIFNSAPVKIQNNVIQIEEEINNPQSTFQ
jgi:phage minor structural protein